MKTKVYICIKFVLSLLLLINLYCIQAQTTELNLKKYWYYRERLKDEFIFSTGNSMAMYASGTNIPAEFRTPSFMKWADATWHIGFYLGMLATEYKLLKDYGQDYSETMGDIIATLHAIDRLDIEAELFYGATDVSLNGFFIRDDVHEDFKQYFDGITTLESDYINPDLNEMSQDQVWSLLVGLALVNELVDVSYVQQHAREITYRMIKDAMQFTVCPPDCPGWLDFLFGCDDIACTEYWGIKNPVTGEFVARGGDPAELLLTGPYFAEAGNYITGHNYYPNAIASTPALLPLPLRNPLTNEFERPYNNTAFMSLASVAGDVWDIIGTNPTYNRLVDYMHLIGIVHSYPHTGEPTVYEHTPLVHSVLHASYSTIDRRLYERLLDLAPECGPKFFNYPEYKDSAWYDSTFNPKYGSVRAWSSLNKIACPWQIKNTNTEYNGIDYMFLHNLFFLKYNNNLFTDSYKYISINYPYQFTSYTGVEAYKGSELWPEYISAIDSIIANNTINENAVVEYVAGERIKFLPGFKVETGAKFSASLNPSYKNPLIYQKLPFDDICSSSKKSILQNNYSIEDIHSKLLSPSDKNNSDELIIAKDKTEVTNNINNLEIFIFPNPNYGIFRIIFSDKSIKNISITISNLMGKIIFINDFSQNEIIIDISDRPKGIYFVKIHANDVLLIEKIVVQ